MPLQIRGEPPPSDEIIAAYKDLDGLPESVLKNVIVPTNEADAASLIRTYVGVDRVGPANTHQNDPDAMFKQAMGGPDAEPAFCPDAAPPSVPPPFGPRDGEFGSASITDD